MIDSNNLNSNKLSEQLDTFFDRSRKTIGQWVSSYINSELRKVNGTIIRPVKKPLQDIYDYILLDPHLTSVLEQRKSKVLGEPFGVFVDNTIDPDLTRLLQNQWFHKTQEAVIDSKFYGYNLIEIQELVNNEIDCIKIIPRGNVMPELRCILKQPYQVFNIISIDGRPDSDYYILIDTSELGILNKVTPLVMMKRLVLSMWSSHAEVFGIPPVILKTDNKDQVNKFHDDLTKFVHARKIVIGKDDELTVLNRASSDVHLIYKELIDTCNAEISKAIVGQTMTTDNGSSRSQSEVHERVANEISEADRQYVTHVVNDIIFPHLIALGYPFENAQFKFISKEKRSYQEKLDTIKNLKENGYDIEPDYIKQYLDLPFDVYRGITSTGSTITNKDQKKSPYLSVKHFYTTVCNNCKEVVNAGDDTPIDGFYDSVLSAIQSKIIDDIYLNKDQSLSTDYIKEVGDLLTNLVYDSFNFNADFEKPNLNEKDVEFIKQLRRINYYFSAGKNKLLNQSFTDLLLDEKGDLKPFNIFKKDAQEIGLEFNKNYLKTEYQTATNNALSARDWQSFEDNDVLKYDAVMDVRTRPEHAKLNGLELQKSDPLWNNIMPQNGWNCRCRVVVIPNAKGIKLTKAKRKEYINLVDKDFRFNPGVKGQLFPPDHPYYAILDSKDKKGVDELL